MGGLRVAGGLIALLATSLLLRLEGMAASLWLDEGISVGIASQPVGDIPRLLVQDGSPPLYYLVLHGWMNLFGDGPVALRSLSLLAALVMVPVACWAGAACSGHERDGSAPLWPPPALTSACPGEKPACTPCWPCCAGVRRRLPARLRLWPSTMGPRLSW
ncbi:MAG: hypothetical protein M3N37_08020 [Actinomycetota bacterium]|nr:hypothetical protein [Actinomycetota bacterium]